MQFFHNDAKLLCILVYPVESLTNTHAYGSAFECHNLFNG